jgi:predicted aconitase
MLLTDEEKRMLDGEYGRGTQNAMDFLKTLGEGLGAEKMVRVTSAHILSTLPTEFLEQMIEGVTKTRTMVSLMPCFDPIYWRENYNIVSQEETVGGVSLTSEKDYAKNAAIMKRLKVLPTYSCTPYLIGNAPRRNDVCVWAGTSGQNVANSLFGARAPRHSVTTAVASGITGVIPYQGLLIPENRYAALVIDTQELDFTAFTITDYGALGYYVGRAAGSRNIVFDGLPENLTLEQAKYLLSPLTVDGACTMCHIVGVTPEAPTLEAALGGNKYAESISVRKKDLRDIRDMFNTASEKDIRLAVFGCPHLTIVELGKLAAFLEGRIVKEGSYLMVGVSNPTYALAKDAGYADVIEKAGVIVTNCCVSGLNPFVHIRGVSFVASNSARAVRFFRTQTDGRCKTYFADMEECAKLVTERN